MIPIRNSFFLLLFIAGYNAVAQDTLRYEQFLETIRQNYPVVQRARNLKQSADLAYKAAKGGFDPVLYSGYENKFFDGKNYYSLLDVKLKKPIYTSQFLSAGYQYGQGQLVNPENKTSANGLPFLGVEMALGQGMTFDKRRADVLKSRNYKSYYEAESNAVTNDVLFQASLGFFDWVYANKELTIYNHFAKLAAQRYEGIRSLAQVGEYAAIDTLESAIFLQTRNLDYKTVLINNQKIAANLISLLWTEAAEPMTSPGQMQSDSLEMYYEQAKKKFARYALSEFDKNPVLEKYRAFQSVLEVEKRLRAELIKPKLDISYNLLANYMGNQGNELNTNNYKWGFTFSFPIFVRTAVNEYKISKLNLANNQFEYKNKSNEIKLKIALIQKNALLTIDQINEANKNVVYSLALLKAEELKFQAGESSLFMLNTREARLMDAELKLAGYRLKFIQSVCELVYLHGDMNYKM